MVELKGKIESMKKRDKGLSVRSTKTYDYINKFLKNEKKVNDLKEKLENIDISRLKEKQINKLIDIMPGDIDELKAVLSGENLTLKQDDLNKIVEAIKNA